jgi:hypothetical protein
MPLLYDALVPIGQFVDENNVGIVTLKGLRCADLLRELPAPSGSPISILTGFRHLRFELNLFPDQTIP